ncbi:uncharacterized protein LOC119419950 [Nematolebias whitei]|uniref:uncharacterized protein LOC119419950 n=1 Tax=Nematolebias whitei TaxID=451745 RepID=UPI00189BFBC2|nr:uncharacterized protein LOC119419950 [Nematolebias whitei]
MSGKQNWSASDTTFLIETLKELRIIERLDGRKCKNTELFRQVHKKLHEAGIYRTIDQIKNRWKCLKASYYKTKNKNGKGGCDPASFSFYALMDKLMGDSALNAQAALAQVRERQLAAQSPPPTHAAQLNGGASSSQSGGTVAQPKLEHCEGAAAAGGRALLPPPAVPAPSAPAAPTATLTPIRPPVSPQSSTLRPVLQEAEEAVLTKLRWATTQLQSSSSPEASIELCSLITSCASSLRSLKELSQ